MKTNLITTIAIILIMASCNNKSELAVAENSELIEISKAQFESEKMVIGEPSLYPFTEIVHATGSIIPSVNGQAQISIALPGIINKIYTKQGQTISKGSAMFEVSGNEFIDLQKDFAESAALVSRLSSDYLRAKELYKQTIATQKDFTLAESNYYAENAKYQALKIKLGRLDLDVSQIEKGEYFLSYTVTSPMNGYVSGINATIGQYVEPMQKIAEIVDDKSFQLRLSVFEKNIYKINAGQSVSFFLNGVKSLKYNARIYAVGKTVEMSSKSIECFAAIDDLGTVNIVNNQFVEAEIHTAVDSVMAVPETALLFSENESYLLLYEKETESTYYFKKLKVKTGRKTNNVVELAEQIPSGRLLTNGIYNLQIE